MLNLPREELETIHRLFFQIEQAYWFYEDFLADASKDGSLHFGTLDAFAEEMFRSGAKCSKSTRSALNLLPKTLESIFPAYTSLRRYPAQ